jgi:hypothetical protein
LGLIHFSSKSHIGDQQNQANCWCVVCVCALKHLVKVLPRVKKAGYNVIQLMGIQEHADYSSVGYKVLLISLSNYFFHFCLQKRLLPVQCHLFSTVTFIQGLGLAEVVKLAFLFCIAEHILQ